MESAPKDLEYEFIVVGSGAGGGTVAARLAESGHSVLLLEAGGDPRKMAGSDATNANADRLPCDYDVPAFHAFASENDAMKWDFFVRHYADDDQQRRDWKFVDEWSGKKVEGILYPRAGTLGGCTAHNAQIFIYPHQSDWQYIEELTSDSSWSPKKMRRYFERLENCHHRPLWRWLARLGLNPTLHGWKGWLQTEKAIPESAVMERNLFRDIVRCAEEALILSGDIVESARGLFESMADPNDWRVSGRDMSGIGYTPLTTKDHARMGTRERLLETARDYPNLEIRLNALATRVLLDENNRATGVEFLEGERQYLASSHPAGQAGDLRRAHASREVILAGGAFNSPQLLMLSGIGPREELGRHGIETRVDLQGVGRNLQDRYEVGVVNRMNFPEWNVYKGATFAAGDPQFEQWERYRSGVYTTNGSVLSIFKRSPVAEGPPDLFCLALLTDFQGYFPNYSRVVAERLNYLTWVVLKAHTRNRAGQVKLRSADPREMPEINFRYFEQGADEDLEAMLDGIRFARKLTAGMRQNNSMTEEVPGDNCQSDDELKEFVRSNAWGHHASGTCAIGPREKNGVLGSDFRVHGTKGLRVVDASVFPQIPGTFIVSAIYMVAEKAAEVILSGI
jgi:choline dehydrogenase-like flavoprotein